MVDISTILHIGKKPITPHTPCGKSIDEDDEDYNILRKEVDNIQKLAEKIQAPNWDSILNVSVNILKEKSKDLQVASYLSYALFEKKGYAGLEVALIIYHDLIEEYWQDLFPQRSRGRISAMAWMAEKLGRAVERRHPEKADFETVQRCQTLIERINLCLQEKIGSDAPTLQRLYGSFQQILVGEKAGEEDQQDNHADLELDITQTVDSELQQITQSTPNAELSLAQGSSSSKTSEHSQVDSVLPPASTAFDNRRGAERAIQGCQRTLRDVAAFLLQDNLADPLPYRLGRIGAWMKITTLPDIDQGQLTKLICIEHNIVQRCEEDLRNSRYTELIPAVEATIFDTPLWLDAHYYTVQALEGLGSPYETAKRVVIAHLAGFLRGLPGVLTLCFNNGTPLASEQTRTWIHRHVLHADQNGNSDEHRAGADLAIAVPPPSGTLETQPVRDEMAREVTPLATSGPVSESMTLGLLWTSCPSSQRERFLWHLQQVQYCMGIEAFDVAMYQLESLDAQVTHFGLEAWDPAVCVEVLKRLILCYHALSQTGGTSQFAVKIEQAYARLCRLDVAVALDLRSKNILSSNCA